MGKKEKFIDKSNSVKYHLLHRSLRDEAHALNYEMPSEFVLVPSTGITSTNLNSNIPSRNQQLDKKKLFTSKDHINEFGLANDGYDYSQHFKTLGDGHFISKTGQVGSAIDFNLLKSNNNSISQQFEMPDDVLASVNKLDRGFDAITINPDLMDPDIRAALFDGFDDEGEFEELQDDFVSQVLGDPEEVDFDFDAHIAKLIARSEQSLGVSNNKLNNQFKVRFHQEEEENFEEYEETNEEEEELEINNQENYHGTNTAVSILSQEQREVLELQFENILEEYQDEEIGYLSDIEEDKVAGTIDLNVNDIDINEIFEEYLQEKKDNLFIEGTKLKKGLRASIPLNGLINNEELDIYHDTIIDLSSIDTKKELLIQEELQREYGEEIQDMISNSRKHDQEIETCQAYLQETRIDNEWDCETILSTYSTLDNHPTVIKDTNTKYKKYKNNYMKKIEAIEGLSSSTTNILDQNHSSNRSVSIASINGNGNGNSFYFGTSLGTQGTSNVLTIANALRAGVPILNSKNKSDNMIINNKNTQSSIENKPKKILLTGKLNLPTGYGPSQFERKKTNPERSLDDYHPIDDQNNILNIIQEDDDEEDNDNSDDNNNEDIIDDNQKPMKYMIRPRNETALEKKKRKDKIKEERKNKRSKKKELKTIYKLEGNKIIHTVANEQNIDHISVFKY